MAEEEVPLTSTDLLAKIEQLESRLEAATSDKIENLERRIQRTEATKFELLRSARLKQRRQMPPWPLPP
jgi:hypothetical protein